MTWYAELSEWHELGRELSSLRTVGWLDRDHTFPTGSIEPRAYGKLKELSQDPWEPCVSMGIHHCELCVYEPERVGGRNLFIPSTDCIFVAPELITHYMNAHEYAPPNEFLQAVLECPPMRSMEYYKALLAAGGRLLIQSSRMSRPMNL